ncbi:MAG: MlaD family protein [Gemmatimonadota bacterium]|nr:MlaD family protein [Gemmatimonadota bacterium]
MDAPVRLSAFGIVSIAMVILVATCAFVVRERRTTWHAHARLRDAADIAPGSSPLLFRGVRIGVVRSIHLGPGGAIADLELDRGDVPLHALDSVRALAAAPFGAPVEIVPGPQNVPLLTAGDTLAPASPPKPPRSTAEAAVLRDSIAALVAKMREDSIAIAHNLQRLPRKRRAP